jgi:hypothetical protein
MEVGAQNQRDSSLFRDKMTFVFMKHRNKV